MDSEGSSSGPPGSDNQDSNEPAPPGTLASNFNKGSSFTPLSHSKLLPSSKGVEQAKKRLRAFSIQKKSPITPVQLNKPTAAGSAGATVLIGKLGSVKPSTPKIEDETKKLPKPPKPGSSRKNLQDSYTELQKRTLAEIEDMKRKMELVDLGIPLGLICPSTYSDKAMPTKAMPPIKTFLDSTKVDEIIRDAKKAKAEGKEFKFDYQKILPDYDNPFQRKKEETASQDKEENSEKEQYKSPHFPKHKSERPLVDRVRDKSKRKSDRYDGSRRHSDRYIRARKDDRDKNNEKRSDKTEKKDKDEKKGTKDPGKSGKGGENAADQEKETDVNLNDYLVCDSWSLDNDDKTSSPQVDEKSNKAATSSAKEKEGRESKEGKSKDAIDSSKEVSKTKEDLEKEALLKEVVSPNPAIKIEKLQPVMDTFEFEIDPNDEDLLMLDEDSKQFRKTKKNFDYNQDTNMSDSLADDTFLESVINEIKQENLSDDDSQDKGLVEYDSPLTELKGQGTPELDDSMRLSTGSQRSDYSDSYRSVDSGCKSTESGYRSTESGSRSTESGYKSSDSRQKRDRGQKSKDSGRDSGRKSSEDYKNMEDKSDEKEKDVRLSVEKELDESLDRKMSKSTLESLEMWDFVLKICQPLLFRHDKTKCYKQTRATPTVWWASRPGSCSCVRGRGVVLSELRAQRMPLVDNVYGTDQISEVTPPKKRSWYPPLEQSLNENVTVLPKPEPPRQRRAPDTPQQGDSLLLDREYQRFMEAVWPEVAEAQAQSRSTTPVRQDADKEEKRRNKEQNKAEDKSKVKMSSEGWSQESEVEEEEKSSSKKQKGEEKSKEKARKRKRSSSTLSSATEDDDAKRKKAKKKTTKKSKAKLAKRRRTEKKYLKKLKDKQKKKKQAKGEEEEVQSPAPKKKLKDKKTKKKQQKLKKIQKKKKAKPKSSSSSSSSSSSESEEKKKKRKKKKNKEAAFDVNILNNIKTEKLSDDEKCQMTDQDFSPRRQQEKRHEIINVKEFDLGIQIKQEVVEEERAEMDDFNLSNNDEFVQENVEKIEFKEPQDRLTPQRQDETNLSQCSSQESICSEKPYEKDESHLRPSSQNSNYSFNDVIASQSGMYNKGMENEDKFEYEQENYEMYEQLAMAYQSDVASNQVPLPSEEGTQRIETVVRRRRGEIKCDWRAGADKPAPQAVRPSRWGLKPGEVNIVLTGGSEHYTPEPQPVYRIESIANRNDSSTGSYDEAYMDTYGAMDRLQYGDCFSAAEAQLQSQSQQQSQRQSQSQQKSQKEKERRATLDDRIDQALRHTVLGEIAMEPENKDTDADKDNRERGILITAGGSRGAKRVSFADGYKPGQDSDTEEPPTKKRKRSRRLGCAWPCPASHPDHVPLWDALPPPPPPPGSPPPPVHAAPPLHLLRHTKPPMLHGLQPPGHKFDPSMPVPGFMPPEPPPGLITFP